MKIGHISDGNEGVPVNRAETRRAGKHQTRGRAPPPKKRTRAGRTPRRVRPAPADSHPRPGDRGKPVSRLSPGNDPATAYIVGLLARLRQPCGLTLLMPASDDRTKKHRPTGRVDPHRRHPRRRSHPHKKEPCLPSQNRLWRVGEPSDEQSSDYETALLGRYFTLGFLLYYTDSRAVIARNKSA